jgi:predicted translin family RNA/ssDNA-binding protein
MATKSYVDQVNEAYDRAKIARARLLRLSRTDLSRYESPMLYAHNRDIKEAEDALAEAENDIERLRLLIEAELVDQKKKAFHKWPIS